MTDQNPDPTHIRLAKRVAEELNCSRSTAEQFIEGGFVSVDGQTVEAPGARVRPDQTVAVAPDASPLALTPVTLLLHKPVSTGQLRDAMVQLTNAAAGAAPTASAAAAP